MKLREVLEQADSGLITRGNETIPVIWNTQNEYSNFPKNTGMFYSYGTSGIQLVASCDLDQEVEFIPNAAYSIGIRSLNHVSYLLEVQKHVPHIPEEPVEQTYVFEIKTLIHVKATSLEEAYDLVPEQIRISASDMVYEYNEEETQALGENKQ